MSHRMYAREIWYGDMHIPVIFVWNYIVYEETSTNMVTVRMVEVVSDKFNLESVFTNRS
jgi:hypothetical protein